MHLQLPSAPGLQQLQQRIVPAWPQTSLAAGTERWSWPAATPASSSRASQRALPESRPHSAPAAAPAVAAVQGEPWQRCGCERGRLSPRVAGRVPRGHRVLGCILLPASTSEPDLSGVSAVRGPAALRGWRSQWPRAEESFGNPTLSSCSARTSGSQSPVLG